MFHDPESDYKYYFWSDDDNYLKYKYYRNDNTEKNGRFDNKWYAMCNNQIHINVSYHVYILQCQVAMETTFPGT